MRRYPPKRALASTFLWLAVLGPAAAQEPPQEPEPGRIVRRVERVRTPLVALDRNGKYIDTLTQHEVRVFDNGVEQDILSFEWAELPPSVAFVVGTSVRIKPLLERVRSSAIIAGEIIGGMGEGAVFTFDDDVRIEQDFTPDSDKVIETLAQVKAQGTLSRLGDALQLAVNRLLARPPGRRLVVVVIAEPRDEGSESRLGEALRLAQLFDISVYAVGMSALQADLMREPSERPVRPSDRPSGVMSQPPIPGTVQTPSTETFQQSSRADLLAGIVALIGAAQSPVRNNILETYAQGTGGFHVQPLKQDTFDETLYQIAQDLRAQYVITYRPSNGDKQGLHEIEVRVNRPGSALRYRPAYLLGLPPS